MKRLPRISESEWQVMKVLWAKYVFISSASSFGSLTRLPMAEYRAVPETRQQIIRLMREVEAVARSQGVGLDADVVEKALGFMDNAGRSKRICAPSRAR